jgi:hypothetical protein
MQLLSPVSRTRPPVGTPNAFKHRTTSRDRWSYQQWCRRADRSSTCASACATLCITGDTEQVSALATERERVENPRIPCRSIGCNLHAALFGLYPAQWSSIETTLGVPNFVATFGYSRLMTEVSRPRRPLTLRTPRMPSANFPRARTSISRHLVNGRIRN